MMTEVAAAIRATMRRSPVIGSMVHLRFSQRGDGGENRFDFLKMSFGPAHEHNYKCSILPDEILIDGLRATNVMVPPRFLFQIRMPPKRDRASEG